MSFQYWEKAEKSEEKFNLFTEKIKYGAKNLFKLTLASQLKSIQKTHKTLLFENFKVCNNIKENYGESSSFVADF